MISLRTIITCAALLMAACAPVQRYRPAPISPAQTASSLEARTLLDPALRQFIERQSGSEVSTWPPPAWGLRLLTLAALYFSPAMSASRARVAAAEAAITTAGARPNPTLSLTPGVPSPYLLGLDFAVPVETAGKRGYRVEEAKDLSEAARFDLAETAWKVRSGVRAALLEGFMAEHVLDLAHSQERLRETALDRLEQRFTAGEIKRPDVDSARLELLNARMAARAAEGHVFETEAALAGAIGIPASGLEGIQFSWVAWEHPPNVQSLSPPLIQREAVLNRLDVRRALAEYSAAQAALQLEIAKQHPDIEIGPGYQLEERNSFFTVGLAVTLPLFNRNQGPIAEAEARRKEAAARFLATQAQVIAQSEAALARYRTAFLEVQQTETALDQLHDTIEPMVRRNVAEGESDWLSLNGVLLQGSTAASVRLGALYRVQVALGQMEDAVERPLESGNIAPLSPQSSLLNEPSKEARQ
jgi:outer membrane protein TolC